MKKKRLKKAFFETFITINLISFLVFASALDSDNIAIPVVMILINLACIAISGLFY